MPPQESGQDAGSGESEEAQKAYAESDVRRSAAESRCGKGSGSEPEDHLCG